MAAIYIRHLRSGGVRYGRGFEAGILMLSDLKSLGTGASGRLTPLEINPATDKV